MNTTTIFSLLHPHIKDIILEKLFDTEENIKNVNGEIKILNKLKLMAEAELCCPVSWGNWSVRNGVVYLRPNPEDFLGPKMIVKDMPYDVEEDEPIGYDGNPISDWCVIHPSFIDECYDRGDFDHYTYYEMPWKGILLKKRKYFIPRRNQGQYLSKINTMIS